LTCPEGREDRTTVMRPMKRIDEKIQVEKPVMRYFANLMGNRVASAARLLDPVDKEFKYFFGFHDLKIRVKGEYRIECKVICPTR
jgi:hypothetical protein